MAINGGSSSIKFALHQARTPLKPSLSGKIDRIGASGTTLSWEATEGGLKKGSVGVAAHETSVRLLIDWLGAREEFASVRAVGHRVVHGMARTEPERVTSEVIDELDRITAYAPDHLPREIELIRGFRARHPELPQVACLVSFSRPELRFDFCEEAPFQLPRPASLIASRCEAVKKLA